ncbi:unnamed protein product [Meloidogyne enterolobii]|uniref:Uncharacterized protein n=1 Tax=Meloidogyne enterolobii TaxID=390850 RepID=A0ACB0ZLJ1_MELEN
MPINDRNSARFSGLLIFNIGFKSESSSRTPLSDIKNPRYRISEQPHLHFSARSFIPTSHKTFKKAFKSFKC